MGESSLLGLKGMNSSPLDDASCIDDAMEILLENDVRPSDKPDTEMYAYSQQLLG